MREEALKRLTQILNYPFSKPELLELATIHKSYGNEVRPNMKIAKRDNERLEFLGDAILDLVITEMLLEKFPEKNEGDLSKLRASIVNEKSLADIARKLSLGDFMLLGKGEDQTGGRQKDSILSSGVEAIIAAIYVDGGWNSALKWVKDNFTDVVDNCEDREEHKDYKTRLQELAQARFKSPPNYEVISALGPDHEKVFTVKLSIHGNEITSGTGKNKKEAEQAAAKSALEVLTKKPDPQ